MLDKEFGPLLEDGDVYELHVPIQVQEDDEQESAVFDINVIAHA